MPVIRLFLLLVTLGALILLLTQNWSPALALTFLGFKTQALPLAIWLLLSVGAGAVSAGAIALLFQLSNYISTQVKQRRRPASATASFRTSTQSPRTKVQYTTTAPPNSSKATNDVTDDDWTRQSSENDDWDFAESVAPKPEPQDPVKEHNSSTRTSSYSYSYQQPSNSSVGKTESIYDADYRVITPPYRQDPTPDVDDDRDWDFDWDDDDFDDDSGQDVPKRR